MKFFIIAFVFSASFLSCGQLISGDFDPTGDSLLLSLGDSYTIGTGVRTREAFPFQFNSYIPGAGKPEIVAQFGWKTSDLLDALGSYTAPITLEYVTLLIGVNNIYTQTPFSVYQTEFPLLLDLALSYVGDDPSKVRVISIPDYRYTPVGRDFSYPGISDLIDSYNDYAESVATSEGVEIVYITDISRQGFVRPELVSQDGIHLSGIAYREIAARLVDSFLP
jgi:acyl-CoA thioesterase-1